MKYKSIKIAIVTSIGIGLIFYTGYGGFNNFSIGQFLRSTLYSLSIGIPMSCQGYIYKVLNRRYINWIEAPVRSVFISLFTHIISSVIIIVSLIWFWYILVGGSSWVEISNSSSVRNHGLLLMLTNFIVTIIFQARSFLQAFREAAVEGERLKREALVLQYEVAKNQVNPHFLFNALNTAQTLVDIDTEKSKEYLMNLSHFYRDLLTFQRDELVLIDREIDFAKKYIYLQTIRFGTNFQVDISMEESSKEHGELCNKYQIIPMTLQTLIENIVKHNEISSSKPLRVQIQIKDSRLTVINSIQPKQRSKKRKGTGLDSLSKRYQHLTNRPVVIECDNGIEYSVTIPLLKVE